MNLDTHPEILGFVVLALTFVAGMILGAHLA